MDEVSYASAGSNVVISEAPRIGATYTCSLAGAFTGLAGMLVVLPPKRSQEDKSRTTTHKRSGVKRVAGFLLLKFIRMFLFLKASNSNMLRLALSLPPGRPQGSPLLWTGLASRDSRSIVGATLVVALPVWL